MEILYFLGPTKHLRNHTLRACNSRNSGHMLASLLLAPTAPPVAGNPTQQPHDDVTDGIRRSRVHHGVRLVRTKKQGDFLRDIAVIAGNERICPPFGAGQEFRRFLTDGRMYRLKKSGRFSHLPAQLQPGKNAEVITSSVKANGNEKRKNKTSPLGVKHIANGIRSHKMVA
jgi:hypothetical protein